MTEQTATETATSIQWHLVRRPVGEPTGEDIVRVEAELPPLADGEVRVRNEFLSVDPYMRGRMNDMRSYIPPFVLGEVMTGGAVGTVVASRAEGLSVGDVVVHDLGWRDVSQADAREFRPARVPDGLPSSLALSVLGVTGFTAWIGLKLVAGLREGDVVFVSGAAGAVGSMVGQLARLMGASRVVGSAGTAEKVGLLTERYGFDAGFDYTEGGIARSLRSAAPDGIDVYFDNVGGEHLEAALRSFNDGGRAALCGAISVYNATSDPGVKYLSNVITRGLTLSGFTIVNYWSHLPAFAADMRGWLADGLITWDETVVDGIDATFDAFTGVMNGAKIGKMIVRL